MGSKDDPEEKIIIFLANFAVSISVMLTYPLMLFPCVELINELSKSKKGFIPVQDEETLDMISDSSDENDAGSSSMKKNVVTGRHIMSRVILVFGTFIVAILIPNIHDLISLAGALAGACVALIIPPLLNLRYVLETHPWYSSKVFQQALLFILGTTMAIVGTYSSVEEIFLEYRNQES